MLFDFRDSLTERATIRRDGTRGSWMRLLGEVLKLGEGRADLVRHAVCRAVTKPATGAPALC